MRRTRQARFQLFPTGLNPSTLMFFIQAGVHAPAARVASSRQCVFMQCSIVGVALHVSFTYHINPMPSVHACMHGHGHDHDHGGCGGPFGPHNAQSPGFHRPQGRSCRGCRTHAHAEPPARNGMFPRVGSWPEGLYFLDRAGRVGRRPRGLPSLYAQLCICSSAALQLCPNSATLHLQLCSSAALQLSSSVALQLCSAASAALSAPHVCNYRIRHIMQLCTCTALNLHKSESAQPASEFAQHSNSSSTAFQ